MHDDKIVPDEIKYHNISILHLFTFYQFPVSFSFLFLYFLLFYLSLVFSFLALDYIYIPVHQLISQQQRRFCPQFISDFVHTLKALTFCSIQPVHLGATPLPSLVHSILLRTHLTTFAHPHTCKCHCCFFLFCFGHGQHSMHTSTQLTD